MACQTRIEGTFVRAFTRPPVGLVATNGKRIVFDLFNIFHMDDEGRMVEEYVRTDNKSVLEQLGVAVA